MYDTFQGGPGAGTSSDYKFQGWMGLDAHSVEGNMEWREYEPKKFDEERDVDIQVG